jgi:flagellar biosynthetic protein FlhB
MVVLIVVVGLMVWRTLSGSWDQLVTLPAHSIDSSNSVIRSLFVRLLTNIIGVIVVMAAADFFITRWKFEESIKMTKAEVKEDMKSMEGNPAIKGKIRSIMRATARKRMMARIKDADVIVTNPTHYAVALEYKPEKMMAPRVIAKGRDLIAQKIKALGREYDIPQVENVPLARALYRLVDIDQDIPLDLYKAVAEVLAHVFKLRKGLR